MKAAETLSLAKDSIKYVDLYKSLRVSMKGDVRNFNERIVQEAVENKKSIKKVRQYLGIGRKEILAVEKE